MLHLFITGHKGFETALFHEIRDIVADTGHCNKVYGGVEVKGQLETAYRIALHSRLANRLYLQLANFKADNEEALYQGIYAVDWSRHLDARASLAVSTTLSRSNINHSHYAALKVKDAVVDWFRNNHGSRPVVQKERPDLHLHVNIHQNKATLSLDLSGEPLHRRGYRLAHAGAPLKENLAAALLVQAGWKASSHVESSLLDPMCGSGTFVIEAAMVSAGMPPGLNREYFGFLGWKQHQPEIWAACRAQAKQEIDLEPDCELVGLDNDPRAIRIARENAERAGVSELVRFEVRDIEQLDAEGLSRPPLVILNPPYGERLQAEQGLSVLYQSMGRRFRELAQRHPQTRVHIISANPDLLYRLRMNRYYKKAVNNGPLKCVFASFDAPAEKTEPPAKPVPARPAVELSSVEGQSLLNRLRKNDRHLAKWARRNDVTCYRVYDADIPEFSFALDRYASSVDPQRVWYHLQEYQAPKTIDEDVAAQRIELAQRVVSDCFAVPVGDLYCKTRQRQRGRDQYEKQDKQGERFAVREGDAELLVNLSDYLDTGLFLDHRITRQMVREQTRGKSLLNLFCYTGSVSLQAAIGGASLVTSVDMSKTYLDWARENFEHNGLEVNDKYDFVLADCVDLLKNPRKYQIRREYDAIFLDPPSFSNSKKMRETLDVQRDHRDMILQASLLLATDGVLYFSTNRRGFKLDPALSERFAIQDLSAQTLPEDFRRNPRIHQCWVIQRRP